MADFSNIKKVVQEQRDAALQAEQKKKIGQKKAEQEKAEQEKAEREAVLARADGGKPGSGKPGSGKPGSGTLKPPDSGEYTRADSDLDAQLKLLQRQYLFREKEAARRRREAKEDQAEARAYAEAQKEKDRAYERDEYDRRHRVLDNVKRITTRTHGVSAGRSINWKSRTRVEYRDGQGLTRRGIEYDAEGNKRFGAGSTGKGYKMPEKRDDRYRLRQGWMPKDMYEDKDGKRPDYRPEDFGLTDKPGVFNEPGGRFQGGYLDPQYREEYIRYKMEGYDPSDTATYGRAQEAAEQSWDRLKTFYDRRFRMFGEGVLRLQDETRNGKAASPAGPGPVRPPPVRVVKDLGLDAFEAYATDRFGPREFRTYAGSDAAAKMYSKKNMEAQAKDAWAGARFAQQRRDEDAKVQYDAGQEYKHAASVGLTGAQLAKVTEEIDARTAANTQGPTAGADVGRPSTPKPLAAMIAAASPRGTGERVGKTGRRVGSGQIVFDA